MEQRVTASIRPLKRVPTDYEAEAAAMLLHTAGQTMPIEVRLHYWRTWYALNMRSYAWQEVSLDDAATRLRRFFERYRLDGEVFTSITTDGDGSS